MLNKIRRLFSAQAKVTSENTHDLADKLQLATQYHQQGVLDRAEALYMAILNTNSAHFDALQLLGLLKHQQGHHEAAVELLERALKINDTFYALHLNLGSALKSLNKYEASLKCYNVALSIQPDNPIALTNQASVLFALQQYEEALSSCDKVLTNAGDDILALTTKGNALMKLNRQQEALINYKQALAYANTNSSISISEQTELLNNEGIALFELRYYQEALLVFDTILSYMPNHSNALYSRGNCLFHLKQFHEAINSFEKALAINPACQAAHLNQGLCRLLIGDFEKGWEEYEWRAKTDNGEYKHTLPAPLWLGDKSLAGKTIFLYAEQGLGDTILALRYIKKVAELGAHIILGVQSPLKSIANSLSGVDHVIIHGEYSSSYDYHCPLMSLPFAFQTTINTIPSNTPYLFSKIEKMQAWQERLKHVTNKRVGIVWSGNPDNKTDQDRSIKLTTILKLKRNDITLICLKKDISDSDKKILSENNIEYFDNELHDFNETAALIDCLDLTICVDTSVAHLAGAMGKPIWVLLAHNADWRWLLNRNDSPWYPTARLFRQQTTDWEPTLADVKTALLSL